MKIDLNWVGGVRFEANTGSGHQLLLDGPPEHGGINAGARPMETFLSAAAACSSFDVVHILKKGRQPLKSLQVMVKGRRADEEPRVFTHIHLHFNAIGDLKKSVVRRAVRLSVEKYCSALRMLACSCVITHSSRIA